MDIGIFDLEVREKKNQAYLNKARTGSKGGSRSRKGMNTPYDYMNKKERNNLNGEVEVFNMYTSILPIKEFELKDEETQKELLTKWRDIHDNIHIRTQMGLNNAYYYELVKKLGIPKKAVQYKPRKAKVKKEKSVAIESAVAEMFTTNLPESDLTFAPETVTYAQIAPAPAVVVESSNGLNLQYNGEYTAEQLVKLFTKLQLITEGEENKFKLSINLVELG